MSNSGSLSLPMVSSCIGDTGVDDGRLLEVSVPLVVGVLLVEGKGISLGVDGELSREEFGDESSEWPVISTAQPTNMKQFVFWENSMIHLL